MKQFPYPKLVRLAGVTLGLAMTVGVLASALAGEPATGKGGATLLTKPQPTVIAGARDAMPCPTCKSDYVTRKDLSARGAIKPTQIVERHLCQGCDTKMATAGAGKMRKTVAAHKCSSAPAKLANCCAVP